MGKHPIKYVDFLLKANETISKFVRVLVNTCGQRNHDYWFIIFVMSANTDHEWHRSIFFWWTEFKKYVTLLSHLKLLVKFWWIILIKYFSFSSN